MMGAYFVASGISQYLGGIVANYAQIPRNITDPALANIAIPFANPGLLHKITDPDAGDTLYVITAQRPVRGFIKRQDLVDLALLESAHGEHLRGRVHQASARMRLLLLACEP